MSEEPSAPPLRPGFTRIGVLLKRPDTVTNGDLVRATGVPLEELGPVLILGAQAQIDVAIAHAEQARGGLATLGPTQVVNSVPIRHPYRWVRLQVGRNHGLSMGQLRKLLTRYDAGPIGRIHINNTHTLVGVRADHLDGLLEAGAAARTNGAALRPELLPPNALWERPDYKPGAPR